MDEAKGGWLWKKDYVWRDGKIAASESPEVGSEDPGRWSRGGEARNPAGRGARRLFGAATD